jgi:hypothetical protein
MASKVVSLKHFARYIFNIQKADFDVLGAVSGFTGIGKSTFSILLELEHAKVSGLEWDLSRLTWSRSQLLRWINGGKDGEGQLDEYSALISDELFMMFYKRNWFADEQKEALTVLKSCRDRHLFMLGNIPNFWELDKNFCSQVGFYVYIAKRGEALVFQQENNPFTEDSWNRRINVKLYAAGKIEESPNFLFKIYFNDLDAEVKKSYLALRNSNRIRDLDSNKPQALERYKDMKLQRAKLIQLVFDLKKQLGEEYSNADLSKLLGIGRETVRASRQLLVT